MELPINFRRSPEYKLWRANVYASDKWTCRLCNKKAKRIEAHHIKTYRSNPELALDLMNGVTLCFRCHRTIYGKEHLLESYFTALRANGVNSVETHDTGSVVDNTEPNHGGNSVEGVTTRNRVFRIEQFITKQVPCDSCGKILSRHYYRTNRSKIFFCSRACRGVWVKKNAVGWNRKPRVVRACLFCKRKMAQTPSQKHRVKKFCNNSCQSKYLWRVLKRKPPTYLNGRWTHEFESCIGCGTKKVKHYGKGRCMACYNKNYWKQRR